MHRKAGAPTIAAMDSLGFDDLKLFARVAALGTLSAVARERDVPVSQVSRTLARIEKACDARLIHRSTHGLSLTAEGQTFSDYCRRMVGMLDELEGEFASKAREPSGLVRVAASTVVARQIGTLGRALYAAPAYAAAHGLPRDLDGLAQHRLVTNSAVHALNQWPFIVKGKRQLWPAEGQWRANDTNMAATMVLQGLGIGRLATLVGDVLLRQGLLVPVLEKLVDANPVPVHAVTAPGRHRLPKIRACLDDWAEWFARPVRAEERAA